MVVYNDAVLIHLQGSVVNFSHSDTAYVLIVVNGADEHLRLCLWISLRSRNVL